MRRILLPLLALILAGGTTFAVRSWMQGQRNTRQTAPVAAPAVVTRNVLVAAERIGSGQFLRAEIVRWQPWPDGTLPETYVTEGSTTLEELTGAVIRRPVVVGEPLTRPNMIRAGDRGFLAAVLDPGTRAVSVAVDEASSNAGLIFPGDHVDLVMSQLIPGGGDGTPDRRFAQTILGDARVIAMGNRLSVDGTEVVPDPARTVTLQVTPAGAERVALAGELGKLTLALRSLARSDGAAEPGAPDGTWDSEVSRGLASKPSTGPKLIVMRGPQSAVVTPGTGASQ